MTSNEERRNLAAKLKETCDEIEDEGNALTEWELAVVLNIRDDDSSAAEGLDLDDTRHLADLIDPTCHIMLKPSDSDFNDEPHYLCSRCGKEGIDVYERNDYTLAGIIDHANYCSYCGARVVLNKD